MKHFTEKDRFKLKAGNRGTNALSSIKPKLEFYSSLSLKRMFSFASEDILFFPKYSKVTSNSIIRIFLPNWIEKKYLDIYYKFSKGEEHNIDANTAKKLIDMGNFFQNYRLILKILKEMIQPSIRKETCITILTEIQDKSRNKSEILNEGYSELINICIEEVATNLDYLSQRKEKEINMLKEEYIEEILNRCFYLEKENGRMNFSLIIDLLIRKKKLKDIFELLESRRKETITRNIRSVPMIVWKISFKDVKSSFYKESNDFSIENINNILIVYYNIETDYLKVALRKCKDNNNDKDKRNKEAFRILGFLSLIEIPEFNFKSCLNFNCLYSSSNSKILLAKITNFSKIFNEKINVKGDFKEFTLNACIEYDFTFSYVLMHICKNFYQYYSLNSISLIPKNLLTVILKSENLNIKNEQQKLIVIGNYLKYKDFDYKVIKELYSLVNWNKVNLDNILELLIKDSGIIKRSNFLKDLIIKEFDSRFQIQYYIENDYNFTQELVNKLAEIFSKYIDPNNENHSGKVRAFPINNYLQLNNHNDNYIKSKTLDTKSTSECIQNLNTNCSDHSNENSNTVNLDMNITKESNIDKKSKFFKNAKPLIKTSYIKGNNNETRSLKGCWMNFEKRSFKLSNRWNNHIFAVAPSIISKKNVINDKFLNQSNTMSSNKSFKEFRFGKSVYKLPDRRKNG